MVQKEKKTRRQEVRKRRVLEKKRKDKEAREARKKDFWDKYQKRDKMLHKIKDALKRGK